MHLPARSESMYVIIRIIQTGEKNLRQLPPAARRTNPHWSIAADQQIFDIILGSGKINVKSLHAGSDCSDGAQQADFQNGFPAVTKPEGSQASWSSHCRADPPTAGIYCRPGRTLQIYWRRAALVQGAEAQGPTLELWHLRMLRTLSKATFYCIFLWLYARTDSIYINIPSLVHNCGMSF